MNAKEAREIIKSRNGLTPKPYSFEEGIANGYFKALKGPEVKALVEALEEMYDNELCWDTKDEEECGECGWCKAKKAINQYHEAISKP